MDASRHCEHSEANQSPARRAGLLRSARNDGVTAVIALLLATPALADNGHSGVAAARTGPELSDIALFVVAAIAVWLTRRALRNRSRKG